MRLVVDANVLFSALIRDGVTRKLFFEDRLELFAPEYLFEEFAGHRKEILQKSQRSEVEFGHVMTILRGRITEIPFAAFGRFMQESRAISPDEKDAAYFAVALAINGAIWSNDKKLKDQNRVKVLNTSEFARFLDF